MAAAAAADMADALRAACVRVAAALAVVVAIETAAVAGGGTFC